MKMRISPWDLRQLEFYEVEYLLEELEEFIEEENRRNRKEEIEYKKQQPKFNSPKMDYGKPNYGGFQTPKINIPTFQRPKF
ncbi:MAG: hypothetical protein PHF86_00565 [Candidatus Nanoarchaeia archaeon]|nr:hypothetical protein [Candidatus Nanoarchaeia archaeon]